MNIEKIKEKDDISADEQLINLQRQINYDTKDYTVELIINKFSKKEFFIPEYQRGFIWKEKNKSLFIESVLLGLPIPFMFFADCEDGKLEIIDGAQRVQTLVSFINNELTLSDLPKLTLLNGFKFSNLTEVQRRRFLNKTLRIIVLEGETPKEIRQDIFNRINTSGIKAKESEVRRGSFTGPLTDFIDQCSHFPLFVQLCPVTETQKIRHERFELLLRFFAYVNDYLSFQHSVKEFLDNFLILNLHTFNKEQYENEFIGVLNFVKKYFPYGFAKTLQAKTTPRVRFEALSVGIALALRQHQNLEVNNIDWINSDSFKELTTSDASNNQGKLKSRIEYVRDRLLESAVQL